MRDIVIDVENAPRFPTGKPIDLGGVVVWAMEFEYEDPDFCARMRTLPNYKVFWTPPNITAMTWPG